MTRRRLMMGGMIGASLAALAGLALAAGYGDGPAPNPAAKVPDAAVASDKPAPADTSHQTGNAKGRTASTLVAKREGDRASMRISSATALAVFQRSGTIWIAWDAPATVDVGMIERATKGMVRAIATVEAPNASVLRMTVNAGVAPRIERASDAWTVELTRQDVPSARTMTIQPARANDGAAVLALRGGALKGLFRVTDPEVGDQILIMPSAEKGMGVASERTFAQFAILPSWQGAAIVSSADRLSAKVVEDGVDIGAEGGLALSSTADIPRKPALDPDTKLVAFDAWRQLAPGTFVEGSQTLSAAAALAKPADRNKARLALAQYKFAYGFPTETLAILEVIGRDDPAFADRPDVTMLRGAARVVVGDLERAQADLGSRSLAGVREASLWRAALSAQNGDAPAALQSFAQGVSYLPSYPSPYKARLGLIAAEAALAQGDVDQTELYLDIVARTTLSETDRNRIAVLRGRILQLAEREEEAFALWNKVRKGRDPRNIVRATLASVDLGLAKGKLAKDEAIQELEPARYAWRGDDLEFRVLRTLGRLYLDVGEHRKGLEALRTATIHFPTHKEAGAVAREMSEAFDALFRDGAFEKMPAVSAVALYNDFGELTPPGAEGDAIVAKLIERMAAIDLLDQAAVLLERQMSSLPSGERRTHIATQLAELRLADQKPQAALTALEASPIHDMHPDLRARRLLVQAKALAALGRTDAALAALREEEGAEAVQLRADIVWRSGQWGAAAQAYRPLLAHLKAGDGKLADADAETVLKGAIALAFSQDMGTLEQVRAQFGPLMANGPYRHAFDVVTSRPSKAELRALLGELGDIGAFKGILASGNGASRQAKAGP